MCENGSYIYKYGARVSFNDIQIDNNQKHFNCQIQIVKRQLRELPYTREIFN